MEMNFILPICVGFVTILLNLIEIVVLIKRGSRKSSFEIILLSLGFADFIHGVGSLLDGTAGLFEVLSPKSAVGAVGILYSAAWTTIAFSVWASFLQIFLITLERFTVVYFPIHHRVLDSKKYKSKIAISILWTASIGMGLLFYFKKHIFIFCSLVGTMTLTVILIIIYGLIIRKVMIGNRQENHLNELYQQSPNNERQHLVVINSGIIIACFILCSSPWMVYEIFRLAKQQGMGTSRVVTYNILAINRLLDPLIYFLFSYHRKKKCARRKVVKTLL